MMDTQQTVDLLDEKLNKLLCRCQQNDKQAFQQLYQLTSKRLVGIAYRITCNIDSANEVLQEAFIQVWQNSKSFEQNKSKAFTWLASIVRYRAYDRLRYEKTRHHDMHVMFEEETLSLEQNNEIADKLNIYDNGSLDYCLKQLDLKQRQSVLMAYLYGYSRDDISEYLKTPINTVKSWIRRGLGRLQACLIN